MVKNTLKTVEKAEQERYVSLQKYPFVSLRKTN